RAVAATRRATQALRRQAAGRTEPTPPGPRSPQHDHVRQYEHVPFDGSDMGRNPAMRYEEEARHDAGLEADDRYDERADFPDGEEERYADEYDEHYDEYEDAYDDHPVGALLGDEPPDDPPRSRR